MRPRSKQAMALVLAMAPAMAAAQSCSQAKATLETFLRGQPKACRTSNDCQAYYIRASACEAPVVLAKPGVPKSAERELLAGQAAVRKACAAEFEQQPACSPRPAEPACVAGRCTDEMLQMGEAAPARQALKFGYSHVRNTCAPWDGPAIGIVLTATDVACGKEELPALNIYIWRELPEGPKTYVLERGSEWGGASLCMDARNCQRAVEGKLVIESFKTGEGASGSYEFKFPDGTVESGGFDAKWCTVREFCG